MALQVPKDLREGNDPDRASVRSWAVLHQTELLTAGLIAMVMDEPLSNRLNVPDEVVS